MASATSRSWHCTPKRETPSPPDRRSLGPRRQPRPCWRGQPEVKNFADWLFSVATNDLSLSGGAERGAVRTTGLPVADPRRQQRRRRRQPVEALMHVGTAAATATRPAVATWGAAATAVGALAKPTTEDQPQEGADLDLPS
ncbi:hypothetical protein MTO96_028741 [Rhipicephalus appendiculatus]